MSDSIEKKQNAPHCIFPVRNEVTDNVVWFEIEPSQYGVYITIHKQQPSQENNPEHFQNGMAAVHVDYFVDEDQQKEQIKVQLWDEKTGPEGDPEWNIPDDYFDGWHEASIIFVNDVQSWHLPEIDK